MTDSDRYTFFDCYILNYNPEPGGTVTVRTRELNLKYDVFRPMPGFDVMLPAGVVYNFAELANVKAGCRDYAVVGVLTDKFNDNVTLRSRYDIHGALACNETRDDVLFPAGMRD